MTYAAKVVLQALLLAGAETFERNVVYACDPSVPLDLAETLDEVRTELHALAGATLRWSDELRRRAAVADVDRPLSHESDAREDSER